MHRIDRGGVKIEVLVKASWEGIPVVSVPIKVYYAKGIGKIKTEEGYAGGDVFENVMTSYSFP